MCIEFINKFSRKCECVSLNISIINTTRDTQHEHLIVVGQSELMWSAALLTLPFVIPMERRPRKPPVSLEDAGLGAEAVYRFAERGVDANVLSVTGFNVAFIVKREKHGCSSRRSLVDDLVYLSRIYEQLHTSLESFWFIDRCNELADAVDALE